METPTNKKRKRSILAPSRPKKRLLNLKSEKAEDTQEAPQKQKKVTPVAENSNDSMKIVFEWQAPERIWKPKDKVWYLSSTVVVMVLILIMAKLGYLIIILGLIAVLMLWFVQGTLEPWIMLHKITSKGIYSNSKMVEWDQIEHFWFTVKQKQTLVHIQPKRDIQLPRFTLLVNQNDEFEIFNLLHPNLTYGSSEEVGHTFISNIVDGEYLPLSLFIPDLDLPPEEH